ncbi:MAG: RNA-binding S4 domain-containing protein [Candidatus Latescibacteria bacterium]|nr:RNA-binding S4 domain-containing protein [Candidatus Latescibacterota bacterium]
MTRLDLYLKYTGLIKQRTEAKRACADGRVLIDGKPVKASWTVKIGEVITIETPTSLVQVKVLDIPRRNPSKSLRETFFQILSRQRRDPQDDLTF